MGLTDFGSEDYEHHGLILFTIRNGSSREPGKTYAEKIMIVGENQKTHRHFHWEQTEDIVNCGGGDLMIELWNSDADEGLLDSPVMVFSDGLPCTVAPGEPIRLAPGESITLTTGLYHRFYGEPGRSRVLAGEESQVNDDAAGNRFDDAIGRFSEIEEEEEPWRLWVSDYAEDLPAAVRNGKGA